MCLDVYQNSQFNSKYTFSIKYLKCYIFNVEKNDTNDIEIVYLIVIFKDTINMLRGERDVKRVDPFAWLLFRDVVMKQARFRQWQTGTTQARQRVILGQAWVFNQRTESRGLDKGVIRKHKQ